MERRFFVSCKSTNSFIAKVSPAQENSLVLVAFATRSTIIIMDSLSFVGTKLMKKVLHQEIINGIYA